jgi:UDP-galactopyranose mutase
MGLTVEANDLILGSGLSGEVFGALMAKINKNVLILETHEHPGELSHTLTLLKCLSMR